MKEDLFISPIKKDDLEYIAMLERGIFPDLPWSYSVFLYEFSQAFNHYFTAKIAGDIVGYAGFAHILDEAHIMTIAVAQHVRGRGYGERLLTTLIKKAVSLSIKSMTLEVRITNTPAISLYKKYGFVSHGIRPNYYGEGEHAEIFWLRLE